jgi:hypothetical protein
LSFSGVFSIPAFAFAAGAVALFFELADELGADESLGRFDAALSAALREHLSHRTLRFFAAITRLGDPEFLITLSAVVAVILVYGLLGYLIVRHAPGAWHVPVTLTSLALIVHVGSSRVLLQVHYLSDMRSPRMP